MNPKDEPMKTFTVLPPTAKVLTTRDGNIFKAAEERHITYRGTKTRGPQLLIRTGGGPATFKC